MILIVSNTSAITLKIDPAVVLATRQYVDDKIIEVKGYADNLMKKHVEAANPHKQYPLIANALKEMVDAGLAGDVLKNLGLGEGAKLGAAVCVTGSTGYMTIPAMVAGKERVIILQWFGATTTDYVTPVTANFPIAFPNECMIPLFSDVSTGAVDLSSTAAYSLAVGRSYYTTVTRTQITCAGYGGFRVFAIGW